MISFQQLLDTTRANSEICCPGFNYWVNTTSANYNQIVRNCCACMPVAGHTWRYDCVGGVQNIFHDATDATSGGLNPFAPSGKIDPETGNYHFYVGSQLKEAPQNFNDAGNANRFRAEFDRNGYQVRTPNTNSLGILCDNSYDRCCCKITRWHCYGVYTDGSGVMVNDSANIGMVYPCSMSDCGTPYHKCGCGGRWTYSAGPIQINLLTTGQNDYGLLCNNLICQYCGCCTCGQQNGCTEAPNLCLLDMGTSGSQQLKPHSAAYDSYYNACGDIPGISFLGQSMCCNQCKAGLCCSACWSYFCGYFHQPHTGVHACNIQTCNRGFYWETGGINYTADHGKTAIFKYGERYAHKIMCCCQCSSPGFARCTSAPFCLCNNSGGGCCHCAWPDYKLFVVANEYHPQEEYWTVLCCCQTHTCRSVWTLNIPTQAKFCGMNATVTTNHLSRCQNNGLEKEFMQTQVIARKTPDVEPNPTSYYVGIVSNRWSNSHTNNSIGTTPTLAVQCPLCTTSAGGSCQDWVSPHGVIWEQDLPTWDGTTTGGCHSWGGKTWYFGHACFCDSVGNLQEHYSIKDIEFRGNKIIVKPNNDMMFQPNCEFCAGQVVQPSVYFCETNCEVNHIFFCDEYNGTRVGSNLSFTKRGTWLVTSPNYNPWFNCCVPGSNCICCCTIQPAYEGFTISEYSEDWSTCIGAIGICLSHVYGTDIGSACCCFGGSCYANSGTRCAFGKYGATQSALMTDYDVIYDYFTDDLVIGFTIPGSRNHYTFCYQYCYGLYANRNHGGINVMKISGDIAMMCEWACNRLKISPNLGCCTVCGGKACDGCFYCLWRCAFPDALITNNGYSTSKCCPGGIQARTHIRDACHANNSFPNMIMFIEPVAPYTYCKKTFNMDCCTINPNIWLDGCLSACYVPNGNFNCGCAWNHLHKLDCSGTSNWAETWIKCIGTCGNLSCYGADTDTQSSKMHRYTCVGNNKTALHPWQDGKRTGLRGSDACHCWNSNCPAIANGNHCHNSYKTANAFTRGVFYDKPPYPIYICEC